MSAWFTENPMWAYFTLGAIAVICVFAYISTKRVFYLGIVVGLGLLAVGLWALDRWVETDREQAERKTHEFAAAAEAGDISKMEQLLSEQLDARAFGSRTQLLSLARQYLTRDGRRSIQFWALETRLARNGQLTVTCNFKAAGQFGSYEIPAQLGLIELVFRKENDSQWRIREFRAMNIQGEDLRVPN